MLNFFRLLHWYLLGQAGVGIRKFFLIAKETPYFIRTLHQFKKSYNGKLEWLPCLLDRHSEGGDARGEYFWQDLHIARKIYSAHPQRHVDIGSRVDGFAAHVASFRSIEVFDIRPLSIPVPGMLFKQVDVLSMGEEFSGYCDSLSCLHALEHFGLGRYGDPINPLGHEVGFNNMAKMLSDGGTFYLSLPIGIERVQFNGQRILAPETICRLAKMHNLELQEFAYVTREGLLIKAPLSEGLLMKLTNEPYSLGIFIFRKLSNGA